MQLPLFNFQVHTFASAWAFPLYLPVNDLAKGRKARWSYYLLFFWHKAVVGTLSALGLTPHLHAKFSYLKYSQLRNPSYEDGASLLCQGSDKSYSKNTHMSSSITFSVLKRACGIEPPLAFLLFLVSDERFELSTFSSRPSHQDSNLNFLVKDVLHWTMRCKRGVLPDCTNRRKTCGLKLMHISTH